MAYTNFYGFIDANYIKNNSDIETNYDDNKLNVYIKLAQKKYIINLLGTPLYNDLQEKIQEYHESGTTISEKYTYLINNYIKDVLMFYALYEALPFMQFKLTNINIASKDSEYSKNVDTKSASYMRNVVLSSAQYFAKMLEDHLCARAAYDYPLYNTTLNNTDAVYPQDAETKFGIWLG